MPRGAGSPSTLVFSLAVLEKKQKRIKRSKWINVGSVAKSVNEDDHWRSLEVVDLIPGTTYEFRIAAQSMVGWGKYGAVSRSCQCEFEPPEIVQDVRIELVGEKKNMLKLQWQTPHAWGMGVDFYELEYQSKQNLNQWIAICETTQCSRFVGLDVVNAGIPYRFRLRSVSSVGYSKFNKESEWWILEGEV